MKNIRVLSENFQFLEVKFSIYLNRRVFVMSLDERYLFNYMCELFEIYTEKRRKNSRFMSYNFCFSVSKEFPVRAKVHVIFEQPSYIMICKCTCGFGMMVCLFVLRFYGPVDPMGSCQFT